MLQKFFMVITTLFIIPAQAQEKQIPCSDPAATQFDFWVGDWVLTWQDSIKGSNTITKEMDGCMIHEKFYAPKGNFKGESWSVYNPATKKWQQTWVDNQGGYMVFEGGMKDGKMELTLDKKDEKGKPVTMSMVFYKITADEFDWEWRKTSDKGKTWISLWKIHYKRATKEDIIAKMKTYYFVALKKGPNRNQDEATANKIQEGHLNHFFKLKEEGKLALVGPMMDEGEILGICIYSVESQEVAIKLANEDPAVKAGRLIAEVHPWFAMPGSKLPE